MWRGFSFNTVNEVSIMIVEQCAQIKIGIVGTQQENVYIMKNVIWAFSSLEMHV